MMNVSGNNPAFRLHEEQETARKLVELLKQEQALLIAADIDALTVLTQEKTQFLTKLSELTECRYRGLTAIGYDGQETGMQAWLETSKTAAIDTAWQELRGLAQEAKEINRVNGLLISKHLVRNQNALNVLKGASQSQSLYGPNGQSSTSTTSTRGLAIG